MTVLYGLATCDTCRKARRALTEAGHDVTLRDVRAEPLRGEELEALLAVFGERLINRGSTTWRKLPEAERAAEAPVLLAAHPALMKRPVIDAVGVLHLGWGRDVQAALIG